MAFVNECGEDGIWRTIDRDRDITLIKKFGPDSSGLYGFKISIQGVTVGVEGYSSEKIHGNPQLGETQLYDMDWRFIEISGLADIGKFNELNPSIEEAFKAYGWNFNTDKAASVKTSFNI